MEPRSYTLKDFVGIVALIIIFVLIPAGVYLTSKQTSFFSKADESIIPKNIKVENITSESFTVSWETSGKPTLGFVSFGLIPDLGNSSFDDKDTDVRTSRTIHLVTLKNLVPDTKYYFKIGSDGAIFDDNGKPFEQITAPNH